MTSQFVSKGAALQSSSSFFAQSLNTKIYNFGNLKRANFSPFLNARGIASFAQFRNSQNSQFTQNSQFGPNFNQIAIRQIATHSPHLHTPLPPPREVNADGSPKTYRLTQISYNHKYDWERWTLLPVGVFHTVYRGDFAKDVPPFYAWLLQYNMAIVAVPMFLIAVAVAFVFNSLHLIGIRPRRYTYEWMLANKERERAENSNPVTRYLDRRRKERGPNWIAEDYFPTHPFFLNMSKMHHDTQSNN